MIAYRTILTMCFALFLSSCMATPVLTGKNADMSREIKQKAPSLGSVDISPDGRYVLSGSSDSFILWDILKGEKIQTFSHPKVFIADVTAVAFSPDGKHFASGSKGIKLWDLATRQEMRTIGSQRTTDIVFSFDEKYILANEYNGSMTLWDMDSGNVMKGFRFRVGTPSLATLRMAISPDGRYALSGHRQEGFHSAADIVLWNVLTGNEIKRIKADHGPILPPLAEVRSVAFSPDGKYALSGGYDNILKLWDIPALTEVKTFKGHTGFVGIMSVAFSPDGKYALSAGSDGRMKIWDLAAGSEWRSLAGHTGMGGALAKFSPNGKYVISAGDASTRIWDVYTGEEVASMIA